MLGFWVACSSEVSRTSGTDARMYLLLLREMPAEQRSCVHLHSIDLNRCPVFAKCKFEEIGASRQLLR